jgi:hypothetical protein
MRCQTGRSWMLHCWTPLEKMTIHQRSLKVVKSMHSKGRQNLTLQAQSKHSRTSLMQLLPMMPGIQCWRRRKILR